MKFSITEEEKLEIRQLYSNLLNEQKFEVIRIDGSQPYPNTDWDMVHAFFGSKRLDDDLEQKVSDKLNSGNFKVENVIISSEKQDNKIITKGLVYVRNSNPNEIPDKYFTTRGSIGQIGSDYINRHDQQVNGLPERLKSYYKSANVKQFGPFEILINDTNYGYKQSFFAVEGQNNNLTNKKITIEGSNLLDLRDKMKSKVNISIEPESFMVDITKNQISFNLGTVKVKSLSFIYDDQNQLDNRIPLILQKNPNMKIGKKGKTGNIEWAVLYFV